MSRNYLFVVAHSDDELLGCGATIQKLVADGHHVSVCCMTHDAPTREANIYQTMLETHRVLGIENSLSGISTAMELCKHDRHGLVSFIEDAIRATKPDVIVTHSNNDLHKDHVITSELTLEAMRLPQRLIENVKPIKEVLMFEIPCSTAWGIKPFEPNKFIDVTEKQLQKKIELTEMYENVIRRNPHPRSKDNIMALARVRGCQGGFDFAEAYRTVYSTEI